MFLVEKDYLTLTHENVLDTSAIESKGITKEEIFASCDSRAVGEVKSYLNDKYDHALMFFDILTWDANTAYLINAYVYYNPTVTNWSSVIAYSIGDHVFYEPNGNTYIAIANTTAGNLPTDITKFSVTTINRKIYKTKLATPAGTLVTNTTYYEVNDPRDPYLVSLCVDIFLYHLISRVVPRNVPERIGVKYADVISILRDFADNRKNTHAPFPLRTLTEETGINKGYDISWGSATKIDNANNNY
jgi:hypothetical protein